MRWRSGITLFVLLCLVVGAAYYGWRTVLEPVTADEAKAATNTKDHTSSHKKCAHTRTFAKGETVKAKDVSVNVFNAGSIQGLAGDTLAALGDFGFDTGTAANSPSKAPAVNVTLYGANPRSPVAQLVAQQFEGHVKVKTSPNLEGGVDVVVGDDFVGLAEKPPDHVTVAHKVQFCRVPPPSAKP